MLWVMMMMYYDDYERMMMTISNDESINDN